MKSVLITGGTGSFGRAFAARLLAENRVERICILSRDEHKQAWMARDLADGSGRLRFFIGDVRDRDRLRRAFAGCEVVVHAAALKRIETGAYDAAEMVKTNVNGAINVIEAATDAGVEKVVALSTDKAWQPISPYGQSKALAEALFLNANNARGANGPRFAVTRYGNVWNSNGSVVPTWRKLIAAKQPVPITDPDCTRFFMTMAQAVNLVCETIDGMEGGELRIPALPAYRLGDLVAVIGENVEPPPLFALRGLPPWEKLHEGMCDGNTSDKARRMSVRELKHALEAA